MRIGHRWMGLVVVVLVFAGAAWDDESNVESPTGERQPDSIIFPVQDPANSVMQALIEGTLTLRGSCLYVSGEDPYDLVLPIWPDGFSYATVAGKISVLDAESKIVAEVGSPVSMGGGMLGEEDAPLPSELRPRVKSCHGPFWMVGDMTAR